MKPTIKHKKNVIFLLLFVLFTIVLLQACGKQTANSTDQITVPGTITLTETFGVSPFCGTLAVGTVQESQLLFVVRDSAGNPKNDVNVELWTDGFWYSDNNYTPGSLNGVGPFNVRTLTTDSNGRIVVFWSTVSLPAPNPVVPGSPPTAGSDLTGTSYVKVYSGAVSNTFNVNWTVKGCPAS